MRVFAMIAGMMLVLGVCSPAQTAANAQQADPVAGALRELQAQIRDLQASVKELREEAARYRAETLELRKELRLAAPPQPQQQARSEQSANERLAKVEEDVQMLDAKITDQYQTKVESGSKYRVRLSGIALFNLYSNHGAVDNQDNPALALQRIGNDSVTTFGGTLRQSLLGAEVFGPQAAGARTSADVQFDFAGGFPNTVNGVTYGLVRLRTARLQLQWKNTSVVGGQDTLFFAPLAPTSFASLSAPALSYAGVLWGWIPQLRVEHTIPLSAASSFKISAGILDGITGEPPASEYHRQAQAGESAGQPAYATRIAWTRNVSGRPLTLGAAAYYNRQNWRFDRQVDGWAAMSDVTVPLGRWFSLTGEFYRGRAIGGLGGAVGRSVVVDSGDAAARVIGLNSVGGWAQLKFAPSEKLEFNGAFGQDNPFAAEVRNFSGASVYPYASVTRNRGSLVNVIARPRSDLVLSLEYRRLRTFEVLPASDLASQVNLSMAVLF